MYRLIGIDNRFADSCISIFAISGTNITITGISITDICRLIDNRHSDTIVMAIAIADIQYRCPQPVLSGTTPLPSYRPFPFLSLPRLHLTNAAVFDCKRHRFVCKPRLSFGGLFWSEALLPGLCGRRVSC